jgi:hypothetical protein
MKTIFTSNYSRHGSSRSAIGISYKRPQYFSGAMMFILAPNRDDVIAIRNQQIDQREYTKRYIETLKSRQLNPQYIIDLIPNNAILLCFEPPGEFCHRRVLAEWLRLHTGINIEEIATTNTSTDEEYFQ